MPQDASVLQLQSSVVDQSSSPSKDHFNKQQHQQSLRTTSHHHHRAPKHVWFSMGSSSSTSKAPTTTSSLSLLLNRKFLVPMAMLFAGLVVMLRLSPIADLASTTDLSNRSTKASKNPIRLIAILGERNSGTRWTFDHLSTCFNHSVEVRKGLTRYKHWFQYDNVTKYPHDTLVLAQFRNAYDWLKAMEHVPHHAPAHMRTKPDSNTKDSTSQNDWNIFLTKPWTTEREGLDLEIPKNSMCQEDFLYRDLISCVEEPFPHSHYSHTLRYSENQPFYEMRNDGSGLPYENILEMRTDKIRNFLLDVPNYPGVADVWTLQYEYLVATGTQHLIDRISEWTGITPQCKAIAAQNRPTKTSRIVRADFAAHIRNNLNWTVESWVGYQPEMKYEQAPWRRNRRLGEQSNDNMTTPLLFSDDEDDSEPEQDQYDDE